MDNDVHRTLDPDDIEYMKDYTKGLWDNAVEMAKTDRFKRCCVVRISLTATLQYRLGGLLRGALGTTQEFADVIAHYHPNTGKLEIVKGEFPAQFTK